MSLYLNNKRSIDLLTLAKISKYFNVSIDSLVMQNNEIEKEYDIEDEFLELAEKLSKLDETNKNAIIQIIDTINKDK